MNGEAAPETLSTIPDVQGSADTRELAINKVGIKDIRHPVIVKDRTDGHQHTIATFSMFVFLPHQFKGTHMSRFVKILNDHEKEISYTSFNEMLSEMAELLEADSGYIEMNFPYFVNKKAPVSGVESLLDYEVSLIGEISAGVTSTRIKVQIPVTSLCRLRCAQPAFARNPERAHQRIYLDRGTHRRGRKTGFLRTVRIAQASRRKIRHRTRLR